VLDKSSPAYNKRRVLLDNNKNVALLQAFMQTARQDLHNFLLSRADEVVPGGLVLIYARGRANEYHPQIQWSQEKMNSSPYNKIFEETWEDLVIEVLSRSVKSILKRELIAFVYTPNRNK